MQAVFEVRRGEIKGFSVAFGVNGTPVGEPEFIVYLCSLCKANLLGNCI